MARRLSDQPAVDREADRELDRETESGVAVYRLDQPLPWRRRSDLLRAVRRALIARADGGPLAAVTRPLFSGHAPGGPPLRPGRHDHVFLAAVDLGGVGALDHVLVLAPWRVQVRGASGDEWRGFAQVLADFRVVRAGDLGVLSLARMFGAPWETLTGPAPVWRGLTPYRPTRQPKREGDIAEALARDVRTECQRRGLPRPEVAVTRVRQGARGGWSGWLTLRFAEPVPGFLLLGQGCHLGSGLFAPLAPGDAG